MTVLERLDELRITASRATIDHLDVSLTTIRDDFDDGLQHSARSAVAIAKRFHAIHNLGVGKRALGPERHKRLQDER